MNHTITSEYYEHRDVLRPELDLQQAIDAMSMGQDPADVIAALSYNKIQSLIGMYYAEDPRLDSLPSTIIEALVTEQIARLMGNCNLGQKQAIAQSMPVHEVEEAIRMYGANHPFIAALLELRNEQLPLAA